MDSAAYSAFWDIYDATGIRPEYLIPVLAYESGLNPSLPNRAGAPYYGINQISGDFLTARGITVLDYLTWSASRQLEEVVKPYFVGQVRAFGSLNSGIRVYQAEFYPASLSRGLGLDDAIVSSPSSDYSANIVFDVARKGYITPRDLGNAIRGQLQKPYVQAAISRTYALRPGEVRQDPVFGTDFGSASQNVFRPILLAASILTLGALAAEAISPGSSPLSPKFVRT